MNVSKRVREKKFFDPGGGVKTTKWAFRGRYRARIRLLFLAHTHTRAKIKHKVERYSRKNTILAHKYSLARLPIPSRACPQRATNSREKPSAQGARWTF